MRIDFSACFVTDGSGLRARIEAAREEYNPVCESYFNEILSRRKEAFCESACGFLLLDGLFLKNGINRAELIIAHDENNRPLVYDDGIDFSVSHSEGCALCVLAIAENDEKARIGCDVQFARDYSEEKMNELAKAFMSEKELTEYKKALDKTSAFFGAWTRREAYIKRAGLDVFGSFKDVSFDGSAFLGGVIRASGRNYYYSISVPDNADKEDETGENILDKLIVK